MILFSRVGGAFREITSREWALLSLETVGVVAGILIAFELNEWASRRSQAEKHDQLMQRLFEEAEFDVAVLRGWRDLTRENTEREKRFAVAIAKGNCPPEADWQAVNTVNLMPAIAAPTSVYEELTGAGGLSSVKDREVRIALAEFHATLDWVRQQVTFFRDKRVEVVPPSDARVKIIFDPTQEEPEVSRFDREALCADQSFRNRVAAATRNHVVYSSYQSDMAGMAIAMCAALGESLGKSCAPTKEGGGPLTGDDKKLAEKTVARMRSLNQ